jgi:hypothetical protein
VNFLPASVSVVGPDGTSRQIALPQTAPGEYQATLPARLDGVYTLQVTENQSDGTQSSGFVVPYSPEYRDTGTNDSLVSALAADTGGQTISNVGDALTHDLLSTGPPRPVWPALLVLAVAALVADIGVRRLRLSAFEVRAGYHNVRKRMGYVDERPAARGQSTRAQVVQRVRLIDRLVEPQRPVPTASMSQKLLAAKRRAGRLQ